MSAIVHVLPVLCCVDVLPVSAGLVDMCLDFCPSGDTHQGRHSPNSLSPMTLICPHYGLCFDLPSSLPAAAANEEQAKLEAQVMTLKSNFDELNKEVFELQNENHQLRSFATRATQRLRSAGTSGLKNAWQRIVVGGVRGGLEAWQRKVFGERVKNSSGPTVRENSLQQMIKQGHGDVARMQETCLERQSQVEALEATVNELQAKLKACNADMFSKEQQILQFKTMLRNGGGAGGKGGVGQPRSQPPTPVPTINPSSYMMKAGTVGNARRGRSPVRDIQRDEFTAFKEEEEDQGGDTITATSRGHHGNVTCD